MVPQKPILAERPPTVNGVWRRTLLAVSIVLAATFAVTLLWRTTNWPGSAAAQALVLGFGIAFGARFGSTGRLRGQVTVPVIIGVISAALFFAIHVLSAS